MPRELDLGPFKQRLLLAMLLCRCNNVVLVEQLIDTLWWEGPPRTAHKNIQVYISHLRRLLATENSGNRLRHRPPGYQLQLSPDSVDALRFEDLSRAGRFALRRGDLTEAATLIRQALDFWHGPALSDLRVSPALRAEAARLDDRRLAVYEDWFETELALGHHSDVLEEIESLVRQHPLRERLRSQQLTALYRGGRQAEALAEYDNLRQELAAELGLAPSPALQELYQQILSGHPGLGAPQVPVRHITAPKQTGPERVGAERVGAERVGAERVGAKHVGAERSGPAPEVLARTVSEWSAPAQSVSEPSAFPRGLTGQVVPAPAGGAERVPALRPGPLDLAPPPPLPLPPAEAEVVAHLSGLPRAVDDFTARHYALARLTSLLTETEQGRPGRLVAIAGPPGSGTTALALQVTHAVADRFPGGQLLVPMRDEQGAPRPVGELLDELLERLGPEPRRPRTSSADASTLLRSRLADLRMLLVLDDVVDAAQVRPLLPGTGTCSVLLTSCRHLGALSGVTHVPIDVFTEPEALELLSRIVGSERITREPQAASRIVRACGLLPLGVRIAGARLAGLQHLRLDRFADRLENPRRMLDELVVGDLSVRGCYERYLKSLSPEEITALTEIAELDRSETTAGAQAHEELLEILAGVHAVTLLPPALDSPTGAPGFEMPEPLRVFARGLRKDALALDASS